MAIQLKKAGFEEFTILEKGQGIGGTWWYNSYPGAECDVQSHLYSFSFEQKNDWSRPYAGQPEILEYLNRCADKYELRPHIQLNTAVASLTWHDEIHRWKLTTESGEAFAAQVVISALGMFNKLVWPAIPGIDDFRGVSFHSARWNHDYDLAGKRVGVIGSAASAVQFVPEIVPQVEQLYLYQRTPNWVIPKGNAVYTAGEFEQYRQNPDAVLDSRTKIYNDLNRLCTFDDKKLLGKIEKAGLENIGVVRDAEIRRKLTPNYPFGCKRPLFSDLYYPMFNRKNVELVTENIEAISDDSIVTADGKEREIDCLICSTGFETTTYLAALDVRSRDDLSLKEAWSDGAQAYLGITSAGFPNLFMLYGPNTNQGSILFMIEQQCHYIIRQLERMRSENLAWMDIRPDVMAKFNDQLQIDIDAIEVWQADCGGDFYYRSSTGRSVTQWPHTMTAFAQRTHEADEDLYEVMPLNRANRPTSGH